MRIRRKERILPLLKQPTGEKYGAAQGGTGILRLVAQTLFVAILLHALAAFVFCDFSFSLLF